MAAPSAPSSTVSGASSTTNATTYTPSMSTGSSGRKFVIVSSRSNGALSTTSTGWNLVDQWVLSTTLSVAVFWKDATGSDALVVTSATSTQYSHIALTFAADVGIFVAPTQATGTSTNPNPPAFDFQSAKDFLFAAVTASQGTGVPTVAPAGYSSLTTRAGAGANGCSTSIAWKSTTAAQTENPGTFTQTSSTWLCLTIGFHTIPADRLAHIKGELQSPTKNPVILAAGTSKTSGALNTGAGSVTMGSNAFITSRPSVWASGLTALPAEVWMAGSGGVPTTTNTNLNAYNNRFSAGASMSTTDQAATPMIGKGAPYIGTGGQKISQVIPQSFDRVRIVVLSQPGGPSATIDVNGGATQSVTAFNGTLGYGSQTFNLSGSAGDTVNVTIATVGGPIVSMEAWTDGVYQAQIFNAGWFAGNSSEIASTAAAYSPLYGIVAFAPDLLVLEPNCNDGLALLTLKQVKDNLRTLILTGLMTGSVMYSMWPYTATSEEAAGDGFAIVAKAVCDELGAHFFDIHTKTGFTSYAAQVAAGYSATGDTHELAAGYAAWGGYELVEFDPGLAATVVTPNSAAHAHSATSPTLAQKSTVSTNNAVHAHSATSPTLLARSSVVAADATHGHTATSPTLAAASALVPANAAHAHTAGSPALGTNTAVATDSAGHAHAATSPTISVGGVTSVFPDNAAHGHGATSPTLAAKSTVAPSNAAHAHSVGSPSLAAKSTVSPANATHGHTAGQPSINVGGSLAVDGALHGHTASSPALAFATTVAASSATHAHMATSPTLAANDNAIHPANATHAHWATSPVLVSTPLDLPGYTDPEAIEGGGSVVAGSLRGGGSVVAGSIPSSGRVIAGALRGRP